ncbi:MAG: HlyD family efflux transporter periplasmic adaptor subunit [Chitinophagales bacterium]|nr:HlyD family efflux transporter periplasmic adaptor subunit [Chitinophagales bacterium]MBP8755123.1 HlyD family efflux transporter periplasmic adaptor subunit [Chitinophagales bacterium]MBP9550014.1 HlyD family efflux transporter periplasmic adaptor subunit [Chitinophagales bacterium]MBP9703191.1 HlyD family efflux transporter periplasmic adaptor subunit [Chitinophagales bacterium]
MKKILFILTISTLLLTACNKSGNDFDATGKFEATEIIIATGASGLLLQFNVEEGMHLEQNSIVGIVDTVQLHLKKLQLQAQADAILSKQPDISKQLAAIQEQIRSTNTEKVRTQNLLDAGAATQKQLDDINAQLDVLHKQLIAQQSNLEITTKGIHSEIDPVLYQVDQVNDQLRQSYILNPISGTVLTKYVELGEYVTPAKPLYKIADLSNMILRAYVTGDQLSKIQLNQKTTVSIDDGNGAFKNYDGTITWISDKAEFTPKTIQTKEERANLVYAIKISVPNDGNIKVGMYGEIKLTVDSGQLTMKN